MDDFFLTQVFDDLELDEADRLTVYDDATGKPIVPGTMVKGIPTIGRGVNLVDGISPAESQYLTMNRIRNAAKDLDRNVPWWKDMSGNRRRALLNMSFNLGWPRLSGFKKTLALLKQAVDLEESGAFDKAQEVYGRAAEEAVDSKWARQVGERSNRIKKLIAEG